MIHKTEAIEIENLPSQLVQGTHRVKRWTQVVSLLSTKVESTEFPPTLPPPVPPLVPEALFSPLLLLAVEVPPPHRLVLEASPPPLLLVVEALLLFPLHNLSPPPLKKSGGNGLAPFQRSRVNR